MKQSLIILIVLLLSENLFGQRIQRFKVISTFDNEIVNDLDIHNSSGTSLPFSKDSLGIISVELPGKKKVHVHIFSPKSGLFEAKIKKVDTSVIVAALDPKCEIDPWSAKIDTLSGKIKILICSGMLQRGLTRNDSLFEERYEVQIVDYGDVVPCYNCMIYYNRVVFQYLDNRYGLEWRKFLLREPPGY